MFDNYFDRKRKSFSKSTDLEKDLVRREGISVIYQQKHQLKMIN